MIYIRDNNLYKIARITGPTHNFLAIRLSESKCSIKVKALFSRTEEELRIDEESVVAQVLSGLTSTNLELKTEYYVSEIHYVPSDTKSSSVYKFLTIELLRRIDANRF
ncbi:conserved hypothetical protein [Vibrio nigripulchritudo SFn118]|nr:conserved hypothetical protein [Vibrio nigripulchritudo SFn118]